MNKQIITDAYMERLRKLVDELHDSSRFLLRHTDQDMQDVSSKVSQIKGYVDSLFDD